MQLMGYKLLFLFLFTTPIFGQVAFDDIHNHDELTFKYIKLDNQAVGTIKGLSTDDGCIWVLGSKALYKSNVAGDVKVLSYEEAGIKTIPSTISIDKKGNLWLGFKNKNGYFDFYIYHTRIQLLEKLDPSKKEYASFKDIKITEVYSDSKKNIWFKINDKNFIKYSTKFESIQLPITLPDSKIYDFSSNTFITSENKIYKLYKGKVIDHLTLNGNIERIHFNNIYDFIITLHNKIENTRIIVACKGDQQEIKYKQKYFEDQSKNPKLIYHWPTGIVIYNSHNIISSIRNKKISKGHINDKAANSKDYCIDNYGNIYLYGDDGILGITKKKFDFKTINKTSKQSLRNISIIKDSILQYASYDGFIQQNLNSNEILSRSNRLISYSRCDINNSQSILTNSSESFAILTHKPNGPSEFKLLDEITIAYTDQVQFVVYDKSQELIWQSTKNGRIYSCKIKDAKRIDQKLVYNTYSTIYDMVLWKGQLIISQKNGIHSLTTESPTEFSTVFSKPTHGMFASEEELIIGQLNEGIIILDSLFNITESYGIKEGLAATIIYTILEDNNHNIWAGTDNGLFFINRKDNRVFQFNEADGVGQLDFNYESAYKHSDGRLYFGGINRLIHFHPDSILKQLYQSKKIRVIEALIRQRNNDNYNFLYDLTNLEISENEPEIKLIFGYENILDDKIVDLEYRLNDEKDWFVIDDATLTLRELPYGQNKVFVSHKHNKAKELKININSKRPFYYTSWFTFLGIIFLMSCLGVLFSIYNRRLHTVNQNLEKQIEARTQELSQKNKALDQSNKDKDKIFSVLAHDLKAPLNNLINISDMITFLIDEKRIEDIKVIGNQIQKRTNELKSTIDNLLHWSLLQQDKIFLIHNKFKIKGPIDETLKQFDSLINSKELKVTIEVALEHEVITDLGSFQTIFRNLLHNAIKFSYKKGKINVLSVMEKDSICISITDHGVGIKPSEISKLNEGAYVSTLGPYSEKGTGIGFNICTYFAEKMGGKIELTSALKDGTTVQLHLPLVSPK